MEEKRVYYRICRCKMCGETMVAKLPKVKAPINKDFFTGFISITDAKNVFNHECKAFENIDMSKIEADNDEVRFYCNVEQIGFIEGVSSFDENEEEKPESSEDEIPEDDNDLDDEEDK